MNHFHMDSFSRCLQAIVTPMGGGGAAADDMQLPRTWQDVMLEETRRQAQASVSSPINSTTASNKIRAETLGSPLSEKTLYGDELNEVREKQQDSGNAQESKIADEEKEWPVKYPIAPQHSRRKEKPGPTVIKRGTIPAGPLHFTNPVPTLPKGWVEHTHFVGKLYYVRDASNAIQGAPFTLTIVTDSDPRNDRNRLELEHVHRQVVEAIRQQDMRLPTKVQLFIELYPEQDESWGGFGGYYLADLDNQSVFWVEDIDSLDHGLGDEINFGVFGEQHLKLALNRQFWYHIDYYPLPGSIDEEKEQENLLKQLTATMIDVSTSPTSISFYTASECSAFIESIKKAPNNSKTWQIARIAGFMAEHRFLHYYGHPSARLNYLHAFEVEQAEGAAPALDGSAGQTPNQSTHRRRFGDLWPPVPTVWYSIVAIWLRLCSVFLFDAPTQYHTAMEDLFVDKITYERNWGRTIKTFLEAWSDAILLTTVLLTANMAYLAIPKPENTTYTAEQLSLLCTAANTLSLISTIFSIGSIIFGLINTRNHRGEWSHDEIVDFLQGAHHHHYGFRLLAIIYALPIAFLTWSVLSFAGTIALYCLMATTVIPRVAVLVFGIFMMGCIFVTVWYFWQRETSWRYDVEGASPKRRQRLRTTDWFWGLAKH